MVPSSRVVYSTGPKLPSTASKRKRALAMGWERSELSTLIKWIPGRRSLKENQVLDPVPGLQLHLLGGGVQYMAVPAGVPFLGPVGPRLAVSEQNLTELVRLEDAQALGVPENLEDTLA